VGAAVASGEREELFSEAVLQLIRRMQRIKSEPAPHPITNFSGYAAVTAFHVVHAHFRRAHPERQRLRNRIRHVVRRSASFALWQLPSGPFVCGRASWVGTVSEECSERDLHRIPPLSPSLSVTWSDDLQRREITRALDHIFDHMRKPAGLERLVETVARLFQLPVTPRQAARSERIDATTSIESSLVHRSSLLEVWREIELLPPRQRIALLLGLRDETGSPITSLLIHLRIVTLGQLAAAVELTSDELTAIWDQLPLPDLAIAARLGVNRQQVINLRKSARERLVRRA
jgi:DNA-directed RNA polymerase specialized sigma24 family protein